ncbi:hypothetical protein ACLXBB_32300, partial [Pseudomonas aeruginosa]
MELEIEVLEAAATWYVRFGAEPPNDGERQACANGWRPTRDTVGPGSVSSACRANGRSCRRRPPCTRWQACMR